MSTPPKKRKPKEPEGQPFDRIKGTLIDQARALIPDDLVATVNPERLSRDLAGEATRLLVREMMAAEDFAPPPTSSMLTDDLEEDTDPPAYRIESLLREGQNLLIVAQYKVGKTTLTMQLLKAYCDGGDFLNYFPVKQPDRNVGVWNYELSPQQWRSWAKRADILHTDRAAVLHLRGFHVDLMTSIGQDFAVEWLGERDCEVWIIDTYGAAYCGEENSNSDARDFLRSVENVARRAGVAEIVFTIHRGAEKQRQGEERARGATRVHDWTDVAWTYTKNTKGTRFLSALGRDVEHPEFSLGFDREAGALRFDDLKSRGTDRIESIAHDVMLHVRGLGKCRDPLKQSPEARRAHATRAIESAMKLGKDGSVKAINMVLNRTGYNERHTVDVGLREPTPWDSLQNTAVTITRGVAAVVGDDDKDAIEQGQSDELDNYAVEARRHVNRQIEERGTYLPGLDDSDVVVGRVVAHDPAYPPGPIDYRRRDRERSNRPSEFEPHRQGSTPPYGGSRRYGTEK